MRSWSYINHECFGSAHESGELEESWGERSILMMEETREHLGDDNVRRFSLLGRTQELWKWIPLLGRQTHKWESRGSGNKKGPSVWEAGSPVSLFCPEFVHEFSSSPDIWSWAGGNRCFTNGSLGSNMIMLSYKSLKFRSPASTHLWVWGCFWH